jgi:Protein of unknown function (DUF1778)
MPASALMRTGDETNPRKSAPHPGANLLAFFHWSHAEETLPDRGKFVLNQKQWKEFQAALDAPLRPMPRLKRLLTQPSVFEKTK